MYIPSGAIASLHILHRNYFKKCSHAPPLRSPSASCLTSPSFMLDLHNSARCICIWAWKNFISTSHIFVILFGCVSVSGVELYGCLREGRGYVSVFVYMV